MTDEQILKLAKTCGFAVQDRWSAGNDDVYYECEECELLKFARELYDEGYTKSFKVGHDAGWELNEEVSHRGL